ncbi:unnamed protein product [Symbiodinium natans]|uniref:Uncharacterized protein n=1 Tax=Symbiodinium natans TaxID=878477 RepID=A0A812KVE4_9DINO|nr:unnamed protein product [Symbiodinium natans]
MGRRARESMALRLLALISLASAHKPVFDYTLAANCPICRQYGNSTVKEIYNTPGVQAGVHFQIHMGIRKGHDGSYECVLEEPGCPMTRYFLCAQRVANGTGIDIMRFMNCFNENPIVEPKDKDALAARMERR